MRRIFSFSLGALVGHLMNKPTRLGKALISAARNNNIRKVKELLRRGVDVNYSPKGEFYGRTALFRAARMGNVDVVRILRRHGALTKVGEVDVLEHVKSSSLEEQTKKELEKLLTE